MVFVKSEMSKEKPHKKKPRQQQQQQQNQLFRYTPFKEEQ